MSETQAQNSVVSTDAEATTVAAVSVSEIWDAKHLALRDILGEGALASHITNLQFIHGELSFSVTSKEVLLDVLSILKNDDRLRFDMLIDLCGVDYPEQLQRFEVVYNLLSIALNQRIRAKVQVADGEPVPSVVDLFKAAGWFEREAWDLFGIPFAGNPDLRRILTDYGFEGHPLRKDFPLTGYVEVRYDEQQKRVVYEPVKLTQDFRMFDFVSPWEGMTSVQLAGDEKAVKPKFSDMEQSNNKGGKA